MDEVKGKPVLADLAAAIDWANEAGEIEPLDLVERIARCYFYLSVILELEGESLEAICIKRGMRRAAQRRVADLIDKVVPHCEWKKSGEQFDQEDIWESACGVYYASTPKRNGMAFCPACGGRITVGGEIIGQGFAARDADGPIWTH